MKRSRIRASLLLTSLGFVIAIGVGLFMFARFRSTLVKYSMLYNASHQEHTESLYKLTLGDTTQFIENHYPILHNPQLLKQEAATDPYWKIIDEWQKLAGDFNLVAIYYLTKENGRFSLMISSGMQQNDQNKWLGRDAWSGSPPAFMDDAWNTKEITLSMDRVTNQWGRLISLARPIVSGGAVIGLLVADYDISFMDKNLEEENTIESQESVLLQSMKNTLLITIAIIIIFMIYQIRLNYIAILVPLSDAEAEDRTRLMLDATPMICFLLDTEGNLIDCNQETLNIFGVTEKFDFLKHYYDFCPEYQLNGEPTHSEILRHRKEVIDKGHTVFQWMYRTKTGEPLPVEINLVRVPWRTGWRISLYARDLRETRAREAAARESENRVQVMLDNMAIACYFFDTSEKIVDCNQCAVDLFGFETKQEFLDKFFTLAPEYQSDGRRSMDAGLGMIQDVFENGKGEMYWEHLRADGTPLPVEVTLRRVLWKDGYRAVAYARDLREERAKESALKESENRLRVMLDTMAIACYFFDSELTLIDCNQQAVDLLGCSTKQELFEKFFTFSPEYQSDGSVSIEKGVENLRRVFETGLTEVIHWEHLRADGSPLPVEVTLVRTKWKDGFRLIAYVRDLRKLVETETNLRRIQSLAEASPDINIYLETNGEIRYMNPSLSRITGYTREELLEGGLRLIFSPDDYRLLNDDYIPAALAKVLASFEMTVIAKDGQKQVYSFAVVPVPMYDGSIGIGLQGKDITDLKRMQRDLEIAKDQAERALESEIRYNKAKSDFLSRVSHELRTPLNAIVGLTSIAKKYDNKKEIEQNYIKIRESTEHLLSLVNDILDMTGFDTGNFEFIPAPFNFKKAIDSVIENIGPKAVDKDQVFASSIDDTISDWLFSDERRLKQVLINLLSNAVKFTPEGGSIKLSAQMVERNAKECAVRFEVYDSGIGISTDVLEHLGQVFEQGDNSITREYGGMGLGLSLTKRIVEMMNGQIWVSSEPGKGSCFSFEVKFGVAEPKQNSTADNASSELAAVPDLTGKRVLVVDDVEINREILLMLLEETGAIIDGAEHGAEAIKLFTERKYDLILIDLHMPVMDGFTAAKIIRDSAQPWAKTIPIIAVSAESSGELHSKCLEAGITDHIAKPVDSDVLLKMIPRWLPKT